MNIRNVLHEEIQSEFDELSKIEVGTDKYKSTVDGVTKLVDRAIELEKFYIELEDNVEKRERENEIKIQQIKNDKKDQFVRNGIAVATIVIPTAVTIWGTIVSINFEKNGGLFTTDAGRKFIDRIFKK